MQELLDKSQAKGLDRAVGAAIAFYANPQTALAFPSNELLMRAWGFSERRIQVALRTLEDLGELSRQPHLETFERRRIYVVGSGQLSILETGADLRAPASVRPHDMQTGAQMPSRVKGTGNQSQQPPPTPPASPGGLADPPTSPSITSPAPGVSGARRRRQRRARRAETRAPSVAHEPCPLQDGNGIAEEAEREWTLVRQRLHKRLGDSTFGVWFATAHPHRLDGEVLVMALHPECVAWVRDRFGSVITSESARPVLLVACGGTR